MAKKVSVILVCPVCGGTDSYGTIAGPYCWSCDKAMVNR